MSHVLNGSFLDKMDKILERLASLNTETSPIHSALLLYTLNKVTFLTDLDGYLVSVDFRILILDKFKTY